MSFVEMVQTLTAKIPELEEKLSNNKSNYENATTALSSALSEIDKKKQEIEALKNELDSKYAFVESRLPITATIDSEGIVTLSKLETLNTDGNKVVTANVLQTVLDNLVDYIPEASTEQLGLIKIAKAEDINTDSNSVIGVSTLDEIKQPVDISNFRQKGKTEQGLNYFVDVYNKDFKTMNMFGTITINSTNNRIELPVSILPDSLGIVITPINSTEVIYPVTVDKDYIELVVHKEQEEIKVPEPDNIQEEEQEQVNQEDTEQTQEEEVSDVVEEVSEVEEQEVNEEEQEEVQVEEEVQADEEEVQATEEQTVPEETIPDVAETETDEPVVEEETDLEQIEPEPEVEVKISVSITCCIEPVPVASNVEASLDDDSDEVELSWNVGEE